MLLAYFGPETMLPLTSALAGVAGVFMMFGRQIRGRCARLVRTLRRTATGGPSAPAAPTGRPAGRRLRADEPGMAGPPAAPATGEAARR